MRAAPLQTVDRCTECHQRSKDFFCSLSPETVRAFEAIKNTQMHPKGSPLFVEGQATNGVYLLCQGRMKLSTSSSDGRKLILRIVEPGEVLGLSATVSNIPYEVTAEAIEPCQTNFVQREEFLQFLSRHKDACFNVARHLSRYCGKAYTQIRALGLSHSASERLAKLLLDWCTSEGVESGQSITLKLMLTQEEIAGMIGTSRETVSRVFADFKSKQIVNVKGGALTVLNKDALQALAGI